MSKRGMGYDTMEEWEMDHAPTEEERLKAEEFQRLNPPGPDHAYEAIPWDLACVVCNQREEDSRHFRCPSCMRLVPALGQLCDGCEQLRQRLPPDDSGEP